MFETFTVESGRVENLTVHRDQIIKNVLTSQKIRKRQKNLKSSSSDYYQCLSDSLEQF